MSTAMERKMAERAITGLLALEKLNSFSPSGKSQAGAAVTELLGKLEPDATKQPKLQSRLKLRAEAMLAFPIKEEAPAPVAVPA